MASDQCHEQESRKEIPLAIIHAALGDVEKTLYWSAQARERNRFLSIVCTNNPYADVWQPAEETCDRFAAEQKIDSPQ